MVTVENLINELALTSGSHLNSFLNLRPDLEVESIRNARQRFVIRVNNAIKEISILFALSDNFVTTREPIITINDPNFIDFGDVRVGDIPILTPEFANDTANVFFEQKNFNTIHVFNNYDNKLIKVRYFKMGDLVSKWEDVITLPLVFHEAIKAHIIMAETHPDITDSPESSSAGYQTWKSAVERLEGLGYRKTDMVSSTVLSNTDKGWFEWL